MTDQNPITPPQELVASLRNSAPHGIRDAGVTREIWLIQNAFAAGADQELGACCAWLIANDNPRWALALQEGRRPKPLSLKEQALIVLDDASDRLDAAHENIIRRALEQLDD